MDKLRLLNLACGAKVSPVGDWTNVDFSSPVKGVIEMNILDGLRFSDDAFDVVYSAQFIEHLTPEQAEAVLKEVRRVLKPGGILRLVTPDLEEMVRSYLDLLDRLKRQPDSSEAAKYDWIRLELFDQIVRDRSGGEALAAMSNCDGQMKAYLAERIGYTFVNLGADERPDKPRSIADIVPKLGKIPKKLATLVAAVFDSEATKIGKFRQSGEVHRYVHDAFSLFRLLSASGFRAPERVDPHRSSIPAWPTYQLDVIRGVVDAPLSLYVEARK